MNYKNPSRKRASGLSTTVRLGVAAVAACFIVGPVLSNPVNPTVVNGTASFNQAANVLTVTNSNGAIIHWDKFSIKVGETTHFAQTAASSTVLNRVLNDPTAIYGTLSSNGRVWLVNPAGIMVGPGGRVDTAGFVASTLSIRNEDFLAGRHLFVNDGNAQNVINQGEIRTPAGGSVYLIGSNVGNEGIITTPGGETILAAGATVSLIDSATPGVKVDITGAAGNSTNLGEITAEAGRIGIAGVIVRNSGQLNASSVVSEGGRIFLKASKELTLDAGSRIAADAGLTGRGGDISVWADDTVQVNGSLSAQGGSQSGDGGFIETSGAHVRIADAVRVSTLAPAGKAGIWLIDPYDFTIAASGGNMSGASLTSSLVGGNVIIQSTTGTTGTLGDVNVNDLVTWSVYKLTLNAQNNININANLNGSGSASLALEYGQGAVAAGNPSGYKLASGKQINLPAGQNFSTKLGSDGSAVIYTVIASLGAAGSTSATDLQGMNGGLAGKYALGSNIDASASSGWNSGAGFAPVGNSSTNFTGTFDGLGHTITGLTINRPTTDYVGLFSFTGAGSVMKNVGLIGGSVSGWNEVGGLVGHNDSSAISNSYSTGRMSGNHNVGGLVGYNPGGTITNSYSTGSASGTGNAVGGLVGQNYYGTVSNSYATGSVSGIGSDVGGLVGFNPGGAIANSYSTGTVNGGSRVGGLVGYNLSGGAIANSYSTGNVTGGSSVGGLVGIADSGTVTNSYWDTETSGQTISAGGTGKTSAEMRQQATFSGFDFTNTWWLSEGNTRPFLRMEYSTSIANAHQLQLMA
ncbi:MAG: GLUG motif-containing protein, partial [Sulfuritalea sp.]|nr:GLUG motif-containing protein [Sulfuritalea sp.]